MTKTAENRLQTLLEFLDTDPRNLSLLSEASETALDAGQPDVALSLLRTYSGISPLPPKEQHLLGLASMNMRDFETAQNIFDNLVSQQPDNPQFRFNLSWSMAMLKEFDSALDLLDAPTTANLPQAAMLHIQLLHQNGKLEDAEQAARSYLELPAHKKHRGLLAAISVLAIDIEDEELAQSCAAGAGNHPDALTTMGTLALGEDNTGDAGAMFDQALLADPFLPRALIGKGLVDITAGKYLDAAKNIDQGADIFETHLGSWIASGWAYFLAGDLQKSKSRFEKALKIDDTFAECHGSLAVIDILEGNEEAARKKLDVALRLDRETFSAALANALLLSSHGSPDKARAIIEKAIHVPVGDSGRTIAASLTRLGMSL